MRFFVLDINSVSRISFSFVSSYCVSIILQRTNFLLLWNSLLPHVVLACTVIALLSPQYRVTPRYIIFSVFSRIYCFILVFLFPNYFVFPFSIVSFPPHLYSTPFCSRYGYLSFSIYLLVFALIRLWHNMASSCSNSLYLLVEGLKTTILLEQL